MLKSATKILALVVLSTNLNVMANSAPALKAEVIRPKLHFTPPAGWMNDPNGLVLFKGEYHVFYQHYPNDLKWGPMHWGHAVSRDLVNWTHLPIALEPGPEGYIFSGSIVIDDSNRSGLGTDSAPAMVALYTAHNEALKTDNNSGFESQALAYSLNQGRTWQKYKGNPVLERPDLRDFRDPKVSWHEPSKRWVMVVTHGSEIGFYSSENLIDWVFESTFGEGYGTHEGVWECPDLIMIDNQYALIVSLVPGGPNGGSGTQYFVGDFDGKQFTPAKQHQSDPNTPLWLDWGPDNYAGVTFSNVEAGAPLFMGWASNWNYAQDVPATTWRSALSLPRELFLYSEDTPEATPDNRNTNFRIGSRPLMGAAALWNERPKGTNRSQKQRDEELLLLPTASTHRLSLDLKLKPKSAAQILLSNQNNENVLIELDTASSEIRIDRTLSGNTTFDSRFSNAIKAQHTYSNNETSLELIYDGNIIEVYVDGGKTTLTVLAFPTAMFSQVSISDALLLNAETQHLN